MHHASGQIIYANTKALEMAGLLRTGINHTGVPLGADGLTTSEMKGPKTMTLVGLHVGI